jgi:hypothetical protein
MHIAKDLLQRMLWEARKKFGKPLDHVALGNQQIHWEVNLKQPKGLIDPFAEVYSLSAEIFLALGREGPCPDRNDQAIDRLEHAVGAFYLFLVFCMVSVLLFL